MEEAELLVSEEGVGCDRPSHHRASLGWSSVLGEKNPAEDEGNHRETHEWNGLGEVEVRSVRAVKEGDRVDDVGEKEGVWREGRGAVEEGIECKARYGSERAA